MNNLSEKELEIITEKAEKSIRDIGNLQFKEYIKYESFAKENIIKRKLNSGIIKVSDLNSEEKNMMINFYKRQIAYKKEKLNVIKTRIIKLRQEV